MIRVNAAQIGGGNGLTIGLEKDSLQLGLKNTSVMSFLENLQQGGTRGTKRTATILKVLTIRTKLKTTINPVKWPRLF